MGEEDILTYCVRAACVHIECDFEPPRVLMIIWVVELGFRAGVADGRP